ncbi:hypothetical protein BVY02_01080 [bacterium J17]|nr:hypothetical protein BVY02_01080 [bacterium J17]
MKDLIKETVEVKTHGSFLLSTPKGGESSTLLLGFHGYKESSSDMMEQLRGMPGADKLWLATAEAVHRFYNRDGKVVASWMTSADRELAIADNLFYVKTVVEQLNSRCSGVERLIYLGFSQGASMAYRAAFLGEHSSAGVVAFAGDLPGEINKNSLRYRPKTLICRGLNDKLFNEEQIKKDFSAVTALSVECEIAEFEGEHAWNPAVLKIVSDFVGSLSR